MEITDVNDNVRRTLNQEDIYNISDCYLVCCLYTNTFSFFDSRFQLSFWINSHLCSIVKWVLKIKLFFLKNDLLSNSFVLILEIYRKRQTRCKHWNEYSACISFRWRCWQQWSYRLFNIGTIQPTRYGIFWNSTRIWMDCIEETAWRKCPFLKSKIIQLTFAYFSKQKHIKFQINNNYLGCH